MTTIDGMKDRLQKLLALSRRGHGGEKENATALLERALRRCGLTMAALEDVSAARVRHRFGWRSVHERTLLVQVLCMVLNVSKVEFNSRRGARWLFIDLTDAQAAEVELFYSAYRRELGRVLGLAVLAFISKNAIWSWAPAEGGGTEMSDEDAAAIGGMMSGISTTLVRRRLGPRAR